MRIDGGQHGRAGRDGAGPDGGSIVLGYLTRLTAGFAVLAVVLFDAVSVGAGHFRAEEHAQTAVRAATASYRTAPDVQRAYDEALATVAPQGDSLDADGFRVTPEGVVTLRLRRPVATLLLEKVPPLRRFTSVTRTVTARPAR